METDKSYEFYKNFYEENRVSLLQYKNLREHFQKLVTNVMGNGYYNMGMDVYTCDEICCEDIARKSKGFFGALFPKKSRR